MFTAFSSHVYGLFAPAYALQTFGYCGLEASCERLAEQGYGYGMPDFEAFVQRSSAEVEPIYRSVL